MENVYLRKIKKKVWKKDYSNATLFKYYDKNDVVPYIVAKKKKGLQIFKNIIVKRFRLHIVFFLDKMGLKK